MGKKGRRLRASALFVLCGRGVRRLRAGVSLALLPDAVRAPPFGGQSSYAAAKEGIRGMTRVAATEWGPDGINCNIICPLVMTAQLAAWKEEYPDMYAKTLQGIPAGRFGDAETDIGRTAVFLCSDDAKYISGETVTMQGGSGLRP